MSFLYNSENKISADFILLSSSADSPVLVLPLDSTIKFNSSPFSLLIIYAKSGE